MQWGWTPNNPAAGASPPKIRRREMTPPPMDVTRQLLAAADDHTPEFGALLRVLAATGARLSTAIGFSPWAVVGFPRVWPGGFPGGGHGFPRGCSVRVS